MRCPWIAEEQVAELESVVKDLKVELSEQEENAEGVIKKWQESCSALEEKNSELLDSLESSVGADALNALQAKLAETEKALADAKDALGEDGSVLRQWQGESHSHHVCFLPPWYLSCWQKVLLTISLFAWLSIV